MRLSFFAFALLLAASATHCYHSYITVRETYFHHNRTYYAHVYANTTKVAQYVGLQKDGKSNMGIVSKVIATNYNLKEMYHSVPEVIEDEETYRHLAEKDTYISLTYECEVSEATAQVTVAAAILDTGTILPRSGHRINLMLKHCTDIFEQLRDKQAWHPRSPKRARLGVYFLDGDDGYVCYIRNIFPYRRFMWSTGRISERRYTSSYALWQKDGTYMTRQTFTKPGTNYPHAPAYYQELGGMVNCSFMEGEQEYMIRLETKTGNVEVAFDLTEPEYVEAKVTYHYDYIMWGYTLQDCYTFFWVAGTAIVTLMLYPCLRRAQLL
ncbi:ORF140 [Ranid herpesvirus 2]|uniref:ORF140 n=1 Tax=Ranid herpesvirus 2 TaxID=389214 RepID=Q14VW6_9VIRU|nr:ORF140 [Ranid herpesvirus 2]ABG25637.1 ORF140 [Ranid herpesvirus 2]